MIHLDANVLIRLSVPGSAAAHKVRAWLLAGETFAVSAPAWFEYLSGPVTTAEVTQAEALVGGRVIDFGKVAGHRAADLFNLTGRKRATKLDCMIAATAVLANARLATSNVGDFQSFAVHGLHLDSV